MKHKFDDIRDAFDYVSGARQYEVSAHLNLDTGKTYWQGQFDEIDELPDDFEESDRYISIPHKNELDLGRELVYRFTANRLPDHVDRVDDFFHGRGAYARFKDLLENHCLLQEWYDFENRETDAALRRWCATHAIELESDSSSPES